MTAIIKWETPPPAVPLRSGYTPMGRPNPSYDAILAELQQHPGRWAIVKRMPISQMSRAGAPIKALKDRGCEATQRSVARVTQIYARWPVDAESNPSTICPVREGRDTGTASLSISGTL